MFVISNDKASFCVSKILSSLIINTMHDAEEHEAHVRKVIHVAIGALLIIVLLPDIKVEKTLLIYTLVHGKRSL